MTFLEVGGYLINPYQILYVHWDEHHVWIDGSKHRALVAVTEQRLLYLDEHDGNALCTALGFPGFKGRGRKGQSQE